MNKFDQYYDIRLAQLDDISIIMKFINEHWRKNHILALDRKFFEYEFVFKEQVNFVLAIDKEKNTLEGLFGFLNASHPENKKNKDIWGSFWKVKEGNMPFLGIEIAKRVEKLTECRMELGVGLNVKTAVPLRKKIFKDNVKKMNHYYFLNENTNSFKIAKIKEIYKEKKYIAQEIYVEKLNNYTELAKLPKNFFLDKIPYKDEWYIKKRFFNHPYYKYDVYLLKNEDTLENALLVTREIDYNNKKVIRIVDYIGEQSIIENLNTFFKNLMIKEDYEYIDLYTHGFKESYLVNAGFKIKDEQDRNVIPNYFEPYVLKNIDIWVNYPKEFGNVVFFKADADQDRPNFIETAEVNL